MSDSSLFSRLLHVREKLGPIYGSEDLAIFLYSLVKREKPYVFVELGTGLGVVSLWVAAAMRENGFGVVVTVDNGDHYVSMIERHGHVLQEFSPRPVGEVSHRQFVESLATDVGVAEYIRYVEADIDLSDFSWLDTALAETGFAGGSKIDILFSDFNHSPAAIVSLLAHGLPRMSPVGSVFIDSASTSITAYYILELVEQHFRSGRVPIQVLDCLPSVDERNAFRERVRSSSFRLMHLVERKERKQNSTTWLRVEPVTLTPPLATLLH